MSHACVAAGAEQRWVLDPGRMRVLTAASVLVLLLALPGFSWLADRLGSSDITSGVFTVPPWVPAALAPAMAAAGAIGLILLVTTVLLLLHEVCHGIAFRWAAGVRPAYGFRLVGKCFPVLYTTAPGTWFTRDQYLVAAAAPTVGVNLLGAALLALGAPWLRELLILPLAIHLSGCVGDWWMMGVLARLPRAATILDTQHGFSYHVP